MNAPTTFRAGDSVDWTESLPAYPASAGWVLKYRLLWSSGKADIVTTSAGDDHAASVSASSSTEWAAGQATLVAWVEKGLDKKTLGSQPVTILPDLSASVSHDGRSRNQRALDAAEAALLGYAEGGKAHVAEYEIDGNRMRFRDTQQILDLINHYKRLVAKENATLALLQGGGAPGRVFYRG